MWLCATSHFLHRIGEHRPNRRPESRCGNGTGGEQFDSCSNVGRGHSRDRLAAKPTVSVCGGSGKSARNIGSADGWNRCHGQQFGRDRASHRHHNVASRELSSSSSHRFCSTLSQSRRNCNAGKWSRQDASPQRCRLRIRLECRSHPWQRRFCGTGAVDFTPQAFTSLSQHVLFSRLSYQELAAIAVSEPLSSSPPKNRLRASAASGTSGPENKVSGRRVGSCAKRGKARARRASASGPSR